MCCYVVMYMNIYMTLLFFILYIIIRLDHSTISSSHTSTHTQYLHLLQWLICTLGSLVPRPRPQRGCGWGLVTRLYTRWFTAVTPPTMVTIHLVYITDSFNEMFPIKFCTYVHQLLCIRV